MRYKMERGAMDWIGVMLAAWAVAFAATTPARAEAALNNTQSEAELATNLAARTLQAGPIRLKYEDGQLRYLRVGDREIIRRVYFAVRDGDWNTVSPHYTLAHVEQAADHFVIKLAAKCRQGAVDYDWTGTITGGADGKIAFAAQGVANSDFDSNRIGLCVLLGVQALAEHNFATDGQPAKGIFPKLVSPTLVASQFHQLNYSTPDGLNVSCSLEGATFDMEDQRNWGDSSWKAYAPLPYAYKRVGRGDRKSQTVTILVSGATSAKQTPQDPVRVKIGPPIAGAFLPELEPAGKIKAANDFYAINFGRDQFASNKVVEWSYIPITHLPDDDTIMENVPTIADQARTIRGFNANCILRAGPVHIPSEKSNEPIAGAWAAAMVPFLAMGNIEAVSLEVGPGVPADVMKAIAPYQKKQLISVETTPAPARHIAAFAAENEQGTALFLINRTPHPAHVQLEGLAARKATVLHIGAANTEHPAETAGDMLKLNLAPYEVCRVTIRK